MTKPRNAPMEGWVPDGTAIGTGVVLRVLPPSDILLVPAAELTKSRRKANRPMSPLGPSRHFARAKQSGRLWKEADINRQAEPAGRRRNGEPQMAFHQKAACYKRRGDRQGSAVPTGPIMDPEAERFAQLSFSKPHLAG